jgi:hypothetical protein
MVLVLGFLVWPTIYRYDHMELGEGRSFPVRINRFNGSAEILIAGGWKPITKSESSSSAQGLPTFELTKINGRASIDSLGWFVCETYNGSHWTIDHFTVEITVREKNGEEILSRQYQTTCYIEPLTNHECREELGFGLGKGQTWSWRLVSATGHPENAP